VSDFHQHGPITTLHRLSDRRLGGVERAVRAAAALRRVTLILPCHADDFGRPALARILDELKTADWLSEIVISLNGFNSREEIRAAKRDVGARSAGRRCRVIWADGPVASALRLRLQSSALLPAEARRFAGKGWNVWLALGAVVAAGDDGVIAMHDADISNYRHEMLLRLCVPVIHPDLRYEFAKGYYRRFTEGVMFGRVTRLFVAPLFRAAIRVLGHHPVLDYLSAFRYPLAGECAFSTKLAAELPVVPGWGLEIGLLCEIHRRLPPGRVCQIELGRNYEHRHRPLRGAAGRAGLVEMAGEIARIFVAELGAEGMIIEAATLRALSAAYRKTAAEAVERHAHDALLNSLTHDADKERATVEAFAAVLDGPMAHDDAVAPALPAWNRVLAALPAINDDLQRLAFDEVG
jgi:glucosyl-3-phosphoglycerate synthase